LRTAYQPGGVTGGFGYIPTVYALAGPPTPTLVSLTGTQNQPVNNYYGLGNRFRALSAAATATVTFTGTGLDILCAKGPSTGSISYTVDGGASVGPVSTTTGGSLQPSQTIAAIRGLSAGAHTVVVTASVNTVYLEGFYAYNGDESLGVRGFDAGHYGYKTTDFIETGYSSSVNGSFNGYAQFSPDLVVVALGTNDFGAATAGSRVSPRQYRDNLRDLLTALRGAISQSFSVVLWEPALRGDLTTVRSNGALRGQWADYVDAVRQVARADAAVTLFDAAAVMGDQSGTNPLVGADKLHPTDAGHAALATAMFSLLSAA
jgi:lysophospholipase L1-like esterase